MCEHCSPDGGDRYPDAPSQAELMQDARDLDERIAIRRAQQDRPTGS